ncbi:Uncharacterised protein [Serratia rubidaea]|nr:Uncharacterised protein [Serratia rubidaea]
MNNFIKAFVRLGAAVSALSLISGLTHWPDVMFISSCAMILIWAHAEWDYHTHKQKK